MLLAAGVAGAQVPARAQEGLVRLANVTDPSSSAVGWRNGLELALREINARGGILGRQVVLSHVDTAAVATAGRPYLILASRPLSPAPDIPVLSADRLAGDAAAQGERLADVVAGRLKATAVELIVADGPATRELRDGLTRRLAERRIAVAAEIASAPAQVDFSAVVLRAKSARADALVALVDAAAAPRLLAELRSQGYDRPVLGDAALIERAPETGAAVRAVVGLSPSAPVPPIRDMVRSYERAYGGTPDVLGLAAYSALYVIKAVTERAGKVDSEAFTRALKGAQLQAAEHPGVLLDVRFDDLGYAHRGAVVVESRNGQATLVEVLPP